jgi:F-type H+-transporting ATPase subunit gamma
MSSGALKELRGRIRSVISIQQTTRAMRMISAVKLRRAQDRLQRLRPYRDAAQTILQTLFAQLEEPHLYQLTPNASKTLYVVLSSSRRFRRAYNRGLVRWLLPHLPPPSEPHLHLLGKKAYELLRRTSYPHTFEDLFGGKEVALPAVSALAQHLLTAFQNGEYRAIVLVYNRFKGIGRSLPTMETLLPLSVSASESPKPWLLEPSAEALVESFLPIYVEAVLLGAVQESVTAEHAARMVAMQTATDNAEELLRTLRLAYNKARQASITKELLEIVAGAEALKG